MAIISLAIGVSILFLLILITWLSYRMYQNRERSALTAHNPPTPPPCDDHLLQFDQEIHQILSNPHLSDAEKEYLTNQCAEKYLNHHVSQST